MPIYFTCLWLLWGYNTRAEKFQNRPHDPQSEIFYLFFFFLQVLPGSYRKNKCQALVYNLPKNINFLNGFGPSLCASISEYGEELTVFLSHHLFVSEILSPLYASISPSVKWG